MPRPTRTFLEMDELVALTDAAGEQDSRLAHVSRERLADKGTTAGKVAELLAEGKRSNELGAWGRGTRCRYVGGGFSRSRSHAAMPDKASREDRRRAGHVRGHVFEQFDRSERRLR